jgi:hypothetical protein
LALAALTAAATAGVSTTAVASFDRKMVTTVPTTYVNRNNRRAEPLAWLVATAASQSNSPSSRAISASSIIPNRNR